MQALPLQSSSCLTFLLVLSSVFNLGMMQLTATRMHSNLKHSLPTKGHCCWLLKSKPLPCSPNLLGHNS